MTRQIRADFRPARAAVEAPLVDKDMEALSSALLEAVMHFATAEIATMPPDEAIKAMQDVRSGRLVIALYMAEGVTRVKFNPPKEIEWLLQ